MVGGFNGLPNAIRVSFQALSSDVAQEVYLLVAKYLEIRTNTIGEMETPSWEGGRFCVGAYAGVSSKAQVSRKWRKSIRLY